MKRAIVASLLVFVAVVATAGCLEDGDTEATTMTVAELSNDYNTSQDQANSTMTFWLSSVDEGDTLIIKDTIDSITYDEQNQTSTVTFTSQSSSPFSFEGDITDEFSEDDAVAVTTHIVNVTMQRTSQGQTITYHYETFEEGWDAANETSVPFPQFTIEHAKDTGGGGADDSDDGGDDTGNDTDSNTMSLYEFFSGYKQNRDNESQTIVACLGSLDEGDTVVIEDQLQNLTYNATQSLTVIQFASYRGTALAIEGDITDEFQAGDNVTLTSEIINTTFTYPYQGKNWTIHYETFAGGWDTANNTQAPFPREALQHAEG